MGRIVSVLSGKGGVGKTTVVVNAGAALSKTFGKKVLVIDCNLTTSHLGLALGIHHAPVTLNHILRGEASLEEAIYVHNSGLQVLPASLKLHELGGVDLIKIKPLIREISQKMDYILLDAGPGLGREALSALHASNEVLFVATPTLPAVMDVLRYAEFLRGHEKKHLGIVLNMVQRNESQMATRDVETMTGLPVVVSIPRDPAVPRSLAAEVPSVLAFPDSRASKELMNVARHIAGLPIRKEVKVSPLDSIKIKATDLIRKISGFPSLE